MSDVSGDGGTVIVKLIFPVFIVFFTVLRICHVSKCKDNFSNIVIVQK